MARTRVELKGIIEASEHRVSRGLELLSGKVEATTEDFQDFKEQQHRAFLSQTRWLIGLVLAAMAATGAIVGLRFG